VTDTIPQTTPSIWRALANRRMLVCVSTGFSSGLPLFLYYNLLQAFLKSSGVDLKAIGAFALVGIPWTWKFLWAPFCDRYGIPGFGRRRTWMLLPQVGLVAVIAWMGTLHPDQDIWLVVVAASLMTFLSATQDIAIDALRREILHEDELGLGNAMYVNAYRIAGLVPGALALILADHMAWSWVFAITAAFMVPGIITSLLITEPTALKPPRTIREAVADPFREFITRKGWAAAGLVLAFIFFYKLGDQLCTSLATSFYLEMGFSKTEIGLVAKQAGLWPLVFGVTFGGIWMVKLGINRALWLFGAVQLVSIFGFASLATLGPGEATAQRLSVLAVVIGFEALGVGLGTSALVAYISRECNPAYTATQYALFASLSAVPRTFVNAFAGAIVESIGWLGFFLACAVLGIPGMLLLFKIAPWGKADDRPATVS
jgi:PAT family beta-lactamase induction signal transducer AmpG